MCVCVYVYVYVVCVCVYNQWIQIPFSVSHVVCGQSAVIIKGKPFVEVKFNNFQCALKKLINDWWSLS